MVYAFNCFFLKRAIVRRTCGGRPCCWQRESLVRMSGFEEFVFFGGPCVRMGGVALCRSGLEEPLVFFADFGSAWAVLRFAGAAWKSRLFFLRTLGPHGRCCACRSGLEERFFFFLRTLGPHGRCCACRSGLEEPLFFICGPCVRMGVGGCRYAEAVLSSAWAAFMIFFCWFIADPIRWGGGPVVVRLLR